MLASGFTGSKQGNFRMYFDFRNDERIEICSEEVYNRWFNAIQDTF